jgi:transposase
VGIQETSSPSQDAMKQLEDKLHDAVKERDAAQAALYAKEAELKDISYRYAKLADRHAQVIYELKLLKRRIVVAKSEKVDTAQLEIEFADRKSELDAIEDALAEDLARDPELRDALDDIRNEREKTASKHDGDVAQNTDDAQSHGQQPPPKKKKRKGTGRRNLNETDLPIERIVITDPDRGEADEIIGYEESSSLGYRPAQMVHVITARAKYKVAKNPSEDGSIRTEIVVAPKPKLLIPKALCLSSLIARILHNRFCLGLPFYRQQQDFASIGIPLDDATMGRYAEEVGGALGGIVAACFRDAKENAFCLSTDATGVSILPEKTQVRSKFARGCDKGHFFVVLADRDHVLFEFTREHNGEFVKRFFKGFKGCIQADSCAIYNALFRGDGLPLGEEPPTEVGCWSHCRRGFWEAAVTSKEPEAEEGILMIARLFEYEERWKKKPPSEKLKLRQTIAAPIVDAFFKWATAHHGRGLARGPLRSAMGYAVRQEIVLRRYLCDGRLSITNNDSERALRHIAIGRKNWLFVGSDTSGESAANIFSVVASCKLHGLDPEQYLSYIIRVLPYWPLSRQLELAPKYWAETRARLNPAELACPVGIITVPPPAG